MRSGHPPRKALAGLGQVGHTTETKLGLNSGTAEPGSTGNTCPPPGAHTCPTCPTGRAVAQGRGGRARPRAPRAPAAACPLSPPRQGTQAPPRPRRCSPPGGARHPDSRPGKTCPGAARDPPPALEYCREVGGEAGSPRPPRSPGTSLRRDSGPPAGWGGRCRPPPRPALTVPAAGTIPRAAAVPHRLRSPPPPAARRRCAGAGRWRGPALPLRHRLPPLLPVPLLLRLRVRCRRRQANAQCGAAAPPSRSRSRCRCQIPATVT